MDKLDVYIAEKHQQIREMESDGKDARNEWNILKLAEECKKHPWCVKLAKSYPASEIVKAVKQVGFVETAITGVLKKKKASKEALRKRAFSLEEAGNSPMGKLLRKKRGYDVTVTVIVDGTRTDGGGKMSRIFNSNQKGSDIIQWLRSYGDGGKLGREMASDRTRVLKYPGGIIKDNEHIGQYTEDYDPQLNCTFLPSPERLVIVFVKVSSTPVTTREYRFNSNQKVSDIVNILNRDGFPIDHLFTGHNLMNNNERIGKYVDDVNDEELTLHCMLPSVKELAGAGKMSKKRRRRTKKTSKSKRRNIENVRNDMVGGKISKKRRMGSKRRSKRRMGSKRKTKRRMGSKRKTKRR